MPFNPPRPVAQRVRTPVRNSNDLRTAIAPTVSPTAARVMSGVANEQSVAAMHDLCVSLISTIFYLRSIVPDENFQPAPLHRPAKKDADGNVVRQSSTIDACVFKQGVSASVDEIKAWLDFGLVDAVHRGYLKSLMISIYLDEESREKAFEVYTLNFEYLNGNATVSLADRMGRLGVKTKSCDLGSKFNKEAFQNATFRLIKEIGHATMSLPKLPDCVFDMKLFFNENTPEIYQPPGFVDDSGHEIYLASHKADEAPYTHQSKTFPSTGRHALSCQVASVTHWLPPFEKVIPSDDMNPDAYREAVEQANMDWQEEVEEGEAERDVVWPIEKSIYGEISVATAENETPIESVTLTAESDAGFKYPSGQLLRDGTIQAIPVGQQRWSDEAGENIIEYRNSAAPKRANFADMLKIHRTKPGYEGFSQPTQTQESPETAITQIARRDLSQRQSSSLRFQVPPVSNERRNGSAGSSSKDSEPSEDVVMAELHTPAQPDETQTVRSNAEPQPETESANQNSHGSGKSNRSGSNASTDSTNGPDTPSSTEFNPKTHREPSLPALAQLNRKLSKSASQASRGGAGVAATKKKAPARKPRAKSTSGGHAAAGGAKVKKAPTPKKKAVKTLNAAATDKKREPKKPAARKASPPETIAQAQAQQDGGGPSDPITSFPTPQATPGAAARHHPYHRPEPHFPLSESSQGPTQTQTQPQTQTQTRAGPSRSQAQPIAVPKTHMCRMKSSRGLRGKTYSQMQLLDATLPTVAEESAT